MMTKPLSRRTLCLSAAAGALSLYAATGIAAEQSAPAAAEKIMIKNFAFIPATVTVRAGTRISWTNQDEEPHAIRSADPALPYQSSVLDTGDTYAMIFDKPGKYKYFCSVHPHMVGTIIVQ